MKKKKPLLILISIAIALIIIFIVYYINSVTIEVKEITDIKDPICVEQIKNKSIFDLKYKRITTDNKNLNYHELSFENKTGKEKIYMIFNVHVPQKLIDNKIVSVKDDSMNYGSIYNLDTVPYVTGANVHHEYPITDSELTASQKQVLNDLEDTLYCEAYIDKYIFYLKLSNGNYEIISLDEFKENVAPFENGMLRKHFSKYLQDYKFVRTKKVSSVEK